MKNLLDDFHTVVFDFDGVFTDNLVYVDENAIESVRVSRADGYALDLLRKFQRKNDIDFDILILSTEKNKVVQARAAKLQLACISGESNKLQSLLHKFELERPSDPAPLSGLIYFGNDLNDLPVMLRAGMSFAPNNAHPIIKKISTHVLKSSGGYGFVREAVEFLIGINAMSPEELSEFISDS
jgi:3-deoxy-D-manno-octulosonate 8-phosphate phosphatase (KDO 8-P phosphatase)